METQTQTQTQTREQYVENLGSEMQQWSAQIDQLTSQAENAAENVKYKYLRELDALRDKQAEAAKRMQKLQAQSGNGNWEKLREGMDKICNDVRNGLASVEAEVREAEGRASSRYRSS